MSKLPFGIVFFVGCVFLSSFPVLAQKGQAAQCHTIGAPEARLSCYDKVTEFAKQSTKKNKPELVVEPKEIVKSEWSKRVDSSKLDDSKNVFLTVTGKNTSQCKFKSGAHRLTIRCLENTTSIVLSFGGCFMSDNAGGGRVDLRLDKEKPFKKNFRESNNNQALGLWAGGEAIPLIKSMIDKSELYVRATPFRDNAVEATYNIAGLMDALKPVRKACGW